MDEFIITQEMLDNGDMTTLTNEHPNCRIADGVTLIDENAFNNCQGLQSIILSDSVVKIDWQAFKNCANLESVTFGSGLTTIGYYAFQNCTKLNNITLPSGLLTINQGAFYGCSALTSITIPNSVTTLGEQAFYNCIGLVTLVIGNGLTKIDNQAFASCSGLTSVTIGSGVTEIGTFAFLECTSLASITIPSNVTKIDDQAFAGCTGLTAFVIPDTVTFIGNGILRGCTHLESVTIGSGITVIKNSTFTGCTRLEEIVIPDNITTIEQSAFMSCTGLTNVTIPSSVTSIGMSAFYDCISLTNITIPASVTSIGNSAFYNCRALETVIIEGAVSSIGANAFTDCRSLETIIVPDNFDLSLLEGKIPSGVEVVKESEVYNEEDERLIVKGNERITRDLKVLGKAIVTGTISSKGNVVLTAADKTNTITEDSTNVITSGAVYDALEDKIDLTEKGASNGVATLDATGRVPYAQLPESAMEYKGTWDASTNTPELKDGTGTNGDFYVVEVAGTVNFGTTEEPRNVTFYVNDRAIYDGTTQEWARLPAGEVRSVNGMSGDVTITASNVDYDANTTVKQAIDAKQTTLTFDNAPTTGSSNPVTSDGIKTYVDTQIDTAITQVLNTGF